MNRIYLDNCCFNRPYDDQESKVIRLESEAKMMIQEKIKLGKDELVWSYMLEYENDNNPDEEVKVKISSWRSIAKFIQLESNLVLENSGILNKLGLSIPDSIHLACAIVSRSDFFITTDRKIIKKRDKINEIKILNPIEYIINIEEND
jgi:predicted nucleic acid-binding protein